MLLLALSLLLQPAPAAVQLQPEDAAAVQTAQQVKRRANYFAVQGQCDYARALATALGDAATIDSVAHTCGEPPRAPDRSESCRLWGCPAEPTAPRR